MKKPIKLIAVALIVLLLNKSNVVAQGSNRYLTLGNSTTTIDNLVIADSINPGNSVLYTAEFDIIPNGASETKSVLSEFLTTCAERNTIAVLVLSRVNTNMEVMEERTWNSVTISEIILPEIEASARATAKIRIKIRPSNSERTMEAGSILHRVVVAGIKRMGRLVYDRRRGDKKRTVYTGVA